MQIPADTFEDYVSKIPEERKASFNQLISTIEQSLPKGFERGISYGMIGWDVPLATYPAGYHCTPGSPLPFIGLASQKNFVALYHMGIYADQKILDWFVNEFPNHSKKKLDMGKSCIRFKKMDDITYDLIGELCTKISVEEWIASYEKNFKK